MFFSNRVLAEMEIEPSSIDTKGFQSLLQLVIAHLVCFPNHSWMRKFEVKKINYFCLALVTL